MKGLLTGVTVMTLCVASSFAMTAGHEGAFPAARGHNTLLIQLGNGQTATVHADKQNLELLQRNGLISMKQLPNQSTKNNTKPGQNAMFLETHRRLFGR